MWKGFLVLSYLVTSAAGQSYSSCEDARAQNVAMDAEVSISTNGATLSLYCHVDESLDTAFAYVSLKNPSVSEWIYTKIENGERVAYKAETSFEKVRINETSLKLDTGDFTFSTSGSSCEADDKLLQPCRDNFYKIPLGMAGVCPFQTFDATVQNEPRFTTARTTIDLRETGLALTIGSRLNLSQFVHLGDLAEVIQPIQADTSTAGEQFFIGASANAATSEAASLTGTVEYGVLQDGTGDAIDQALSFINSNITEEDGVLSSSPLPVNLSCDYLINYNWLDPADILRASIPGRVLISLSFGSYTDLVWPPKFTPASNTTYAERLANITSGGYGICTCIEGTDACDDPLCGWEGFDIRPSAPTEPTIRPSDSAKPSSSDRSSDDSQTAVIIGASAGGLAFIGLAYLYFSRGGRSEMTTSIL